MNVFQLAKVYSDAALLQRHSCLMMSCRHHTSVDIALLLSKLLYMPLCHRVQCFRSYLRHARIACTRC